MAGEGQGEERSVYHGEGDRQGGENLPDGDELKTALVTGAAGFIGSHKEHTQKVTGHIF
jgi:hypothetical protein